MEVSDSNPVIVVFWIGDFIRHEQISIVHHVDLTLGSMLIDHGDLVPVFEIDRFGQIHVETMILEVRVVETVIGAACLAPSLLE